MEHDLQKRLEVLEKQVNELMERVKELEDQLEWTTIESE